MLLVQMENEIARMSSKTTDELKLQLLELIETTAATFVMMAAIVRVLEDRGVDLSDIQIGLMPYIRKIAYGQVLPEILQQFRDKKPLLSRLSSLTIPEQKRIASGAPVEVVEICNGATSHRLIRVDAMSDRDIRQVFASDHIRDISEQVSWIRAHPQKEPSRESPIIIDAKRRGVFVSGLRVFISKTELRKLLAELS